MRRGYRDRDDAARVLAQQLSEYADRSGVVVLGLPRGGVPVAAKIAETIGADLDVMVARKVGVPGARELAMGAVAMGGCTVQNPEIAAPPGVFERAAAREMEEVERRVRAYRGDRPLPRMQGRTVILVDDGLATGSTMRAAIQAVRQHRPKRVVVAVPVAPPSTVEELQREADEVVCPFTPEWFRAIGQFYVDFSQLDDDDVGRMLERAWGGRPKERLDEMEVEIGSARLEGSLVVPLGATGIVIFAHGSRSSRMSPRNRSVAHALNNGGLATLLFDLLTAREEEVDATTRAFRFDIGLLAERLTQGVDWVRGYGPTGALKAGLFGASTGAAAALIASADRPEIVRAVVSRGGRPDLAGKRLADVRAPTLLIVGGLDRIVIELNRRAAERMTAPTEVKIVPRATHLFQERGKLESVSLLAREWFRRHLRQRWPEQARRTIPIG